MTDGLAGKIALVTGASSGFGVHFAKVLAEQGVRVALAARRIEALEALKAEIEAAGGSAFAVRIDVSDEDSIVAGIARVEAEFGGIDILINNSGISTEAPSLDSSADEWDRVMDTNLRGSFLVAREVGRAMRAAGRSGSIVNIASITGQRPVNGLAAYAVSKAGLTHLTKLLGSELARYNIRVNALAPGYFPTDINMHFWASDPGKAMIKRMPMRRLGELRDLDGPLLLLASDASRYMTGAVIPVDGGHLCSPL